MSIIEVNEKQTSAIYNSLDRNGSPHKLQHMDRIRWRHTELYNAGLGIEQNNLFSLVGKWLDFSHHHCIVSYTLSIAKCNI
jgi:hypothetical protein